MENIINLYKPIGLTPLQAIQEFKKNNHRYRKEKISYSGRLDPMAQGVLLLLVGDENKNMNQYMSFDKEYSAKILLGFSSDSYDILGFSVLGNNCDLEISLIKKIIKSFKGSYIQKLPVYSSYKIKGKPLFYYARKGKLDEIEIPFKNVDIRKIDINSIYKIGSGKLLKEIVKKIKSVEGDFRQDEILKKWNKLLIKNDERYFVVDIIIGCSSGTYIRAIAEDVGKKLGCGGLLLDLVRTKVGKFDIKKSKRLK